MIEIPTIFWVGLVAGAVTQGLVTWLQSVSSKRRDEAMERHPSTGLSVSLADRDIQIHHGLTREQWDRASPIEKRAFRDTYYKSMGI